MTDHKMAAANDQEQENEKHLQNEMHDSTGNATRDYVLGVLAYLESMTGKKLEENAAELWISRLAKYSRKKLLRLQEYTGGLSNEVFKYLDELRDGHTGALQELKALPEPKTSLGHELVLHYEKLRDIMSYTPKCRHCEDPVAFENERQEYIKIKRKAEQESLREIKSRYPHFNAFA